MENTRSLNEYLETVKAMLTKLNEGQLSITELEELETLARNLYERSVILKYKAFEKRVSEMAPASVTEPEKKVEVPAPEAITEEEQASEEAAFDFSIFDEEGELAPEETGDIDAPEVEEHRSITVKEEITDEGKIKEVTVNETKTLSFSERFNVEDNSLASKLAGGKLDSLIGAFGLNERLRFINNLFEGSSEKFSEAVRILDNQDGLTQAMEKINELAAQHEWDEEDDSVHEFMTYLNRRYA